ncbi:MAG: hypothetical protein EZS28_003264 [Streblomastix strix]|uniref:Uncharacterized protein n=1 Tax=Streblomastix strix TaxID=222440 RepID=A0A5J4X2G9_9EUKA|nr:MAG: hypothetical protein EZS28_003264 [Streblomastix strix]
MAAEINVRSAVTETPKAHNLITLGDLEQTMTRGRKDIQNSPFAGWQNVLTATPLDQKLLFFSPITSCKQQTSLNAENNAEKSATVCNRSAVPVEELSQIQDSNSDKQDENIFLEEVK